MHSKSIKVPLQIRARPCSSRRYSNKRCCHTFMFLVTTAKSSEPGFVFPSVITNKTLGFPVGLHPGQKNSFSASLRALSVRVPPIKVKILHGFYKPTNSPGPKVKQLYLIK